MGPGLGTRLGTRGDTTIFSRRRLAFEQLEKCCKSAGSAMAGRIAEAWRFRPIAADSGDVTSAVAHYAQRLGWVGRLEGSATHNPAFRALQGRSAELARCSWWTQSRASTGTTGSRLKVKPTAGLRRRDRGARRVTRL